MSQTTEPALQRLLRSSGPAVLEDWLQLLSGSGAIRPGTEAEVRNQAAEVLAVLGEGELPAADARREPPPGLTSALGRIGRAWAEHGYTPAQSCQFVLSLKQPLFEQLSRELGDRPELLATALQETTGLVDRLGIWMMEFFQRGRDDVIRRQQQELLELSTPVMKLWEGVLALPLIGTLDSERTQVVMETLLESIVETGADIAIIDITGVPTVDTRVAQHLLQTVAAARLMGADCIISGIRPQIAQTIVQLGVTLPDVVTKPSLADAFTVALKRRGLTLAGPAQGAGASAV